jgi:D-alanine--poly(phosphoribitol) ligase subunit 1
LPRREALLASEIDRLMPARMIEREKITVWNSVPRVVSRMMQAGQVTAKQLASVRLFNFCGEPLLPTHLASPDVLVRNTYGPTEATIAVTDLPLSEDDYRSATQGSVAIGPPIPGVGLHLVGGTHAYEGEIVITGPQLALGYWRDAAKTNEVFHNLAMNGRTERAYYTGDWGRAAQRPCVLQASHRFPGENQGLSRRTRRSRNGDNCPS